MSVAKRGERPLSPHLQVYRLPLNAVLSILHRITGVAMAASAVLVVWWLLAAATSPTAFAWIDGLMTSWLGDLVLTLSLGALWFHFANGIRHLIWDTGSWFGQRRVRQSAIGAIAVAVVMTLVTIWLAQGGA